MDLRRRPSVTSRLSFAVSNAERGEPVDLPAVAADQQIEEEIAEIKRYEVPSASHLLARPGLVLLNLANDAPRTLQPLVRPHKTQPPLPTSCILAYSHTHILTPLHRLGPRCRTGTTAPESAPEAHRRPLRQRPGRLEAQAICPVRGRPGLDSHHHHRCCHRPERCLPQHHHGMAG